MKQIIGVLLIVIITVAFTACETEEDFGFPSKIELSGKGESIEIKGNNELPPVVTQIELLDYNGDGNNSGPIKEESDFIEVTTDWLSVKYYSAEYKLVVIAEPNETNKKRKLYLYLYDGKSRQEITVIQSNSF